MRDLLDLALLSNEPESMRCWDNNLDKSTNSPLPILRVRDLGTGRAEEGPQWRVNRDDFRWGRWACSWCLCEWWWRFMGGESKLELEVDEAEDSLEEDGVWSLDFRCLWRWVGGYGEEDQCLWRLEPRRDESRPRWGSSDGDERVGDLRACLPLRNSSFTVPTRADCWACVNGCEVVCEGVSLSSPSSSVESSGFSLGVGDSEESPSELLESLEESSPLVGWTW